MFGQELEELLPHLRAFGRALCNDPSLADDLVQETCLRAWDAQDSFDPEKGTLKTWLFRILRNEFYSRQRRSWRSVSQDSEIIEAQLVTECALQSSADLSRMMKAVFALKDDQRDAFILIVAAGFTYEEAGQVCGCAAGTIKSRVNRAREKVLGWYHSTAPIPERDTPEIDEAEFSTPIELVHQYVDRVRDDKLVA